MHDHTEQAQFLDVLIAAVFTLWLIVSTAAVGVILFSFFQDSGKFLELLIAVIATPLLIGLYLLIPAFILGGIISLPMWVICKYIFQLNRTAAAIGGALTGLIIALIPFFRDEDYIGIFDFGPFNDDLEANFTFVAIMLLICAISGWNGYRIAWNGRP